MPKDRNPSLFTLLSNVFVPLIISQMLFSCMLNLNWIPPRIWHISDIFLPCPWYGVADVFWSYAQPKLDTPRLWHISNIFLPCPWSRVADAFWLYAQPKLDTPRLWHISDIFSPCPWYGVADAFWSYAQPKLDTPKTLTHFWYLFAMFLIWSCRRFLVVRST